MLLAVRLILPSDLLPKTPHLADGILHKQLSLSTALQGALGDID